MKLGYIGIDQQGNHYKIDKHPRKELVEQTGYKHVQKMYVDTKSGEVKHVGYVVGPLWVSVYQVHEFKS